MTVLGASVPAGAPATVAQALLSPRPMANGARLATTRRAGWDTPERSTVQERFYRELMAVDRLPSAPEIAQRLLVAVNREDAHLGELTRLIVRDQSLVARLLRLANSAFFSVRTRVTSVEQATMLLGFARVRDLALGLSVWGKLEGKSTAARRWRKSLWSHTSLVAASAKRLAEQTGNDAGAAFAAGLLHDVGKLVLGVRLGDSYWSMLDDAAAEGREAAAIETEAFGCHHATVAGWLLQLWALPPDLIDSVALHHEPLSAEFGLDLPAVVAVANRLVDATDSASGRARDEVLGEIRAFAPGLLTADAWPDMYAGLAREQREVAGIFD